ncbi:MAG: hypothetical protein MI864_09965, partial [Pseudomonadales bacterium]|nr:hypothetical protein [Pseudomonadales bacterium]
LSLAAFAKAIFCKEVAVVVPVLAVLVLALVPGGTRPWRRRTLVAISCAFVGGNGFGIAQCLFNHNVPSGRC